MIEVRPVDNNIFSFKDSEGSVEPYGIRFSTGKLVHILPWHQIMEVTIWPEKAEDEEINNVE